MSPPPPLATRELVREERFNDVWTRDLKEVFADVAPYYDRANAIATFGLMGWLERGFMATIDIRPHARVLDVCAGTNAIGIALLKRDPTLEVHAIDRSAEMQAVGQQRARALGMKISSVISDVHRLPFPDAHFDVVTLQFASRHLRVKQVFSEIHRVLKPGGSFYHCDMLRPASRAVETLYYAYLRPCLTLTAFFFGSGQAARGCKRYFIDALQMFYSADELSAVLGDLGFVAVESRTVLGGTVAFHRATKPIGK
ncbi:MAG: methyltransferase domain-containing protein [Betaproteobacteria bacterium]|nr:MAG: methyltransferase domain-containing protein [Betaproteobacteria bacterium]